MTTSLDIHNLDKDIELLKEIRRVMANPRSRELLEQLYLRPKPASESSHDSGPIPSERKQNKPRISNKDENYGQQTKIVRQMIARVNGRFTTTMIGEQIRDTGINMSNIAVGRVIIRLTRNEELRLVEAGGGSVPHWYEKTDKFRADI